MNGSISNRLCGALVAAALLPAGVAWAQAPYPSKPVRFLVGFAPGGGTDIMARTVAVRLAEALNQQVVVENRPGANANLAAEIAAKAAPDGYTVLFISVSHAVSKSLYRNLKYDLERDFIPLAGIGSVPQALVVTPSLPVKSVKELIALARKRPGEITYASFGVGSYPHFATEALNAMAGMRMNHVPYKGSAPAATALLSGEVMAGLDAPQSTLPHLRSGRLRALAMGSTQRIAIAPEIPTFAEVGLPGYTASAWFGLFLPAGTSKAIVDATHREGVRALQLPEIREPLQKAGFQVIGSTPEQFAQQVREDIARFTKIAREAGIKAE